MRRLFSGAGILLLSACAGYNTMQKANTYAAEARRLDKEGRTLEANGFWGRAAIKADSVLARHPSEKHATDATAIKGEALAATGQCNAAARVLAVAIERTQNTETREQATLALATCQLELGAASLAAATAEPVTESKDGSRRERAQLLVATADRQLGLDSVAVITLQGLRGVPALIQRTLAYAGSRQDAAALHAFDSLVALRDSTLPWDSLLIVTGRENPLLASTFTTRLIASRVVSGPQALTYAFDDAERLAAVDTAGERSRYDAIIAAASGNGDVLERARLERVEMQVRAADSVPQLAVVLDSFNVIISSSAGDATVKSTRRAILYVQMLVDSAPPGAPQGDMRRFLAAELARDSLRADRLSASLFQSVIDGWPASPYAAKAWLARSRLIGDSGGTTSRFAASPYMAILRGEDNATYSHLEDSLNTFAKAIASAAPGILQRAPGSKVDGGVDDGPAAGRGRRPRPGTVPSTVGQPRPGTVPTTTTPPPPTAAPRPAAPTASGAGVRE